MTLLALALVTLAAAPVVIEPLGFSVAAEDGGVTVVAVTPGSVAARAGLVPGVVIDRLASPQWQFVRGPLAQLSPQDLHDALTPPHGEPLTVLAEVAGKSRFVSMLREDPAPADPFPGAPLPPERLARLSINQLALYSTWMMMGRRAETVEPLLSFSQEVIAEAGKDGLHQVWNGAWTPDWVYFDGRLNYRCPSSPMRSIELVGAAPVPKVLATSNGTIYGATVPAQVPLWRVRDALEACRRGETHLASTPVTATLRCEGQAPRTVELSHPLTLKCGQTGEPAWRLDGLRLVANGALLTGATAQVELRVSWDRLRPTPASVAVLELDASGGVARRHPALPVPASGEGETKTVVPVDTATPRTLAFALEVKFPDGTVDRSRAQPLTVETPAEREAGKKAIGARLERMKAVQARLEKAFPRPCDAPDETVKWLQAQPEVSAAKNFGGHDLSYVIDGVPIMFMCHEP